MNIRKRFCQYLHKPEVIFYPVQSTISTLILRIWLKIKAFKYKHIELSGTSKERSNG